MTKRPSRSLGRSLANALARPAALAAAALLASAVASPASIIFSDSFETPGNSQNWQVYATGFGDWDTTAGTGIEIQTDGVVVQTPFGSQYVELDSDSRRGGGNAALGSNSAMTREVQLSAGQYRLTWWYLPRTSRPDDNLINVFLDAQGDAIGTTLLGTENRTRPPVTDWLEIEYIFTVAGGGENPYALTFSAVPQPGQTSVQNTLGGFVDNVTLAAIPLPAGITLLGLGLAGIGGMRVMQGRRRRR